ncbi:unnamed protein product, partial [Rangifer tarandus platyrhynchus]
PPPAPARPSWPDAGRRAPTVSSQPRLPSRTLFSRRNGRVGGKRRRARGVSSAPGCPGPCRGRGPPLRAGGAGADDTVAAGGRAAGGGRGSKAARASWPFSRPKSQRRRSEEGLPPAAGLPRERPGGRAVAAVLVSIVVSIPACHAGDRGSIPRRGGNTAFLVAA